MEDEENCDDHFYCKEGEWFNRNGPCSESTPGQKKPFKRICQLEILIVSLKFKQLLTVNSFIIFPVENVDLLRIFSSKKHHKQLEGAL